MKLGNDIIIHKTCPFYNYGKTAPREYGAYCDKHKKCIDIHKCEFTVYCGDCDEWINDKVEDWEVKYATKNIRHIKQLACN